MFVALFTHIICLTNVFYFNYSRFSLLSLSLSLWFQPRLRERSSRFFKLNWMSESRRERYLKKLNFSSFSSCSSDGRCSFFALATLSWRNLQTFFFCYRITCVHNVSTISVNFISVFFFVTALCRVETSDPAPESQKCEPRNYFEILAWLRFMKLFRYLYWQFDQLKCSFYAL